MLARRQGVQRGALSVPIWRTVCRLSRQRQAGAEGTEKPSVAIVSSYNDMLSAHQPFEHFPAIIKDAVREVGGVAQFAGGVPAMCDGVTQGQPGMELSLFSRDTIAMATAVGAVAQHVRRRGLSRHLRQDRAGPADRRAAFRPSAGGVRAGRPDDHRHVQFKEKARVRQLYAQGKVTREELLEAEAKSYHAPAPARSTAPPTATRC
jgi:phosphogluconate dehydratase